MTPSFQVQTLDRKVILDAALSYAKRGWPVFPLHHPTGNGKCSCRNLSCSNVGKHPRTKNGVKDATTDVRIIRNWFDKFGVFNLAISISEFFVLDEDPQHGGLESRCDLDQKFGPLPETVTALTGGGGCHYAFLNPTFLVKNRVGLFPGLDVRGLGGYIVAPPSLHQSGALYCFDHSFAPNEIAIAPAPEWLLSEMQSDERSHKTPLFLERIHEGKVREGKRNDTLTSLAGHLFRRYVAPEIVLDLILAWNFARCEPPLANREVGQLVNSIAGREYRRRKTEAVQ